MNGKKAKELKKKAGYKGESWFEDITYHNVFWKMEKGKKLFYEVVNPIKLKLGSKKLYKDLKKAYIY
jgi:hypothetical protein